MTRVKLLLMPKQNNRVLLQSLVPYRWLGALYKRHAQDLSWVRALDRGSESAAVGAGWQGSTM